MSASGSEVRVIAVFRPRPEHAERLRTTLRALVEPTRLEAGCIQYVLHETLGGGPEFVFHPEFVFYEVWASQIDLDRHLATPPLQRLVASLDAMLAEPLLVKRLRLLT